MLDSLDPDMDGVNTMPEALYPFDVNPGAEPLDEGKAQVFHHYVLETFFLLKRARSDSGFSEHHTFS